jgi:hypothetical protein
MKPVQNKMEKLILEEKTEILIAIGAATASNCISEGLGYGFE